MKLTNPIVHGVPKTDVINALGRHLLEKIQEDNKRLSQLAAFNSPNYFTSKRLNDPLYY